MTGKSKSKKKKQAVERVALPVVIFGCAPSDYTVPLLKRLFNLFRQ
jgi:hypothetical protein